MKKFFTRFKTKEPDPTNASWGNIAGFYSLLTFLIAIPFVLIVALVWLTGLLGFNAYILAGFAVLLAVAVWRLYKGWGRFKQRLAAQSSEFQDLMREAAKTSSNMEVSVMNGLFTVRYQGRGVLLPEGLPPGREAPLALTGPVLEAEAAEVPPPLPPERIRAELAEFLRLRDEGVITAEEFDRLKTSLLQRLSA
ncbi:MAG: gas vesicle protein GvpG [Desulfobaccales bacterium]